MIDGVLVSERREQHALLALSKNDFSLSGEDNTYYLLE